MLVQLYRAIPEPQIAQTSNLVWLSRFFCITIRQRREPGGDISYMNKYFLRGTTISFLFTSLAGLCQSIPQMHLNAQPFKPSTFTPAPYTPKTTDYSILQKSIEKAEDREREANDLYLKLIDFNGEYCCYLNF